MVILISKLLLRKKLYVVPVKNYSGGESFIYFLGIQADLNFYKRGVIENVIPMWAVMRNLDHISYIDYKYYL